MKATSGINPEVKFLKLNPADWSQESGVRPTGLDVFGRHYGEFPALEDHGTAKDYDSDYNLYLRNVGFLLWRTRVIEKAGHQVYSGPKMFWCWSPREENEGFSKYINFCWNIFLLANFRHWVIFIATICHNHKHYLAFLFGSTLLGFNTNISADSPLP